MINQIAYDLGSQLEEAVQHHYGLVEFFEVAVTDDANFSKTAIQSMATVIREQADKINCLMSDYFTAQQTA